VSLNEAAAFVSTLAELSTETKSGAFTLGTQLAAHINTNPTSGFLILILCLSSQCPHGFSGLRSLAYPIQTRLADRTSEIRAEADNGSRLGSNTISQK
jgi:hypothetical protein